jgi:hypothetical protein
VDTDSFDDNPLDTTESLDSDEVRNGDGDEVVDPPEQWIDAEERDSLDDRLAEEIPDIQPDEWAHPLMGEDPADADGGEMDVELQSDVELDRLDPSTHGRERGQIDGAPEDGDSFYEAEDVEE